jgi:hypothetical protein
MRRRGPEPSRFVWDVGVYLKDSDWRLAFKSNTRPGFRSIANIAESCEKWNVPFSVFVEEPVGCRAIEVVIDIPDNAREGAPQRACIELDKGRRMDLVQWLDEYVPRAVESQ